MCTRTGGGGVGIRHGGHGVTVEAVGVVVPLGRGHLGEAEFVLEHLHVLEQRLGGAWWVHIHILVHIAYAYGVCMVPSRCMAGVLYA